MIISVWHAGYCVSGHRQMSHVTYEWVTWHMNKLCHKRMGLETKVKDDLSVRCMWSTSHVLYERVMSHMNEWCRLWTSHVTNKWVWKKKSMMILVWDAWWSMSHVPDEWVMSHDKITASHTNESLKQGHDWWMNGSSILGTSLVAVCCSVLHVD